MRSFLDKCRRVAGSTVICILIGLAGTSTAHAQFFFAGNFAFSCGPVNQALGPVFVGSNGVLRWLVPSMTTTVLSETEPGLRKVKHSLALRMMHPNGNRVWLRNLSVTSAGVAQVIPQVPGWNFGIELFFQSQKTEAPFRPFTAECLGLGTVQSGNETFVVVSMGIYAATGTEASGEDLSHVNFWVLNASSGAVVAVIRPRPKDGRYLLQGSGFYDIDNDGDAEIVLVYGIYFGGNRSDFIYEAYTLKSGVLEFKSRNNQINREIIK
jgi:hypothetical protein